MPTYQYSCKTEGCTKKDEIVEVKKSITDGFVPSCELCHCHCHRVFVGGAPNFKLKGNGWTRSKVSR